MNVKSDIEIAQSASMLPIQEVAANYTYIYLRQRWTSAPFRTCPAGPSWYWSPPSAPLPLAREKPPPSVGLADALNRIGKRTVVCLREPSLGPVFGVKGGAAGGGYAQVVPMEDINLHFTGDFHAIGAANNLLGRFNGQSYPTGECSGHRPQNHYLETRCRYERPSAASHRLRLGRESQWSSQGGRL